MVVSRSHFRVTVVQLQWELACLPSRNFPSSCPYPRLPLLLIIILLLLLLRFIKNLSKNKYLLGDE
jgi:hypothetical protein